MNHRVPKKHFNEAYKVTVQMKDQPMPHVEHKNQAFLIDVLLKRSSYPTSLELSRRFLARHTDSGADGPDLTRILRFSNLANVNFTL